MTRDEIINALREYKEKNLKKYQIQRIGIFGSAAKEQMKEQSDIDIVVELEKQDLFYLIGIKQDLEKTLYSSIDKELALEILQQIHSSIQTILKRFQPIQSSEDFTSSDTGLEKLDAICMQLIAIGESLKNIDKVTNNSLLFSSVRLDFCI